MENKIKQIGMETGNQYEVIITSTNPDGTKNAAPMGLTLTGPTQIKLFINTFTHTLKNIENTTHFAVNISQNSLQFTTTALGDIPQTEFTQHHNTPILKETEAYLICKKTKQERKIETDHINTHEIGIIDAEITDVQINKHNARVLNRGIYSIFDVLVASTRINLVDDETRQLYMHKIKEAKRLTNKVGNAHDKKAMQVILKKLKEKGY